MAIYGTALLAICLLIGLIIGKSIGLLLGLDSNVGGVGIAMLLLILVCDALQRRGRMNRPSEEGILFWSAIYIPVVVAMAACQNVLAAIQGGAVPILAGALAVGVGFALVPVISKMGVVDEAPKELE